jgi:hypothetical protein
MAGRQGFKLRASLFSNVVMARHFWFQALQRQAITSLRFVHYRPPSYSRWNPRRWRHSGDAASGFVLTLFPQPSNVAAMPSRYPVAVSPSARSILLLSNRVVALELIQHLDALAYHGYEDAHEPQHPTRHYLQCVGPARELAGDPDALLAGDGLLLVAACHT